MTFSFGSCMGRKDAIHTLCTEIDRRCMARHVRLHSIIADGGAMSHFETGNENIFARLCNEKHERKIWSMWIMFTSTRVAYLFLAHTDALIPPELYCSLSNSLMSIRSTVLSNGVELVRVDAVSSRKQSPPRSSGDSVAFSIQQFCFLNLSASLLTK